MGGATQSRPSSSDYSNLDRDAAAVEAGIKAINVEHRAECPAAALGGAESQRSGKIRNEGILQ